MSRGDFGLASGRKADGCYERVWFEKLVPPDGVAFEAGVFLLRKATAGALKSGVPATPTPAPEAEPGATTPTTAAPSPQPDSETEPGSGATTLRLVGTVPPEVWNRLGTKILPKLRTGSELTIGLEFTVTVKAESAAHLATELRQILQELGLAEAVRVE